MKQSLNVETAPGGLTFKTKPRFNTRFLFTGVLLALAVAGLYVLSRHNYPLFHSIVDGVTVFIALGVFTLVWTRRHLLDNQFYLFIGIAFLFFGILDFLHLLGNKNMGVFPQYGNLGPALYIASRYVLGISLLVAPLFILRKLNAWLTLTIFSLIVTLLLLSIFYWQNFPVTYIDGVGLTSFKVISDYVICAIILGAAGLLWLQRSAFDPKILRLFLISLVLSIATGLSFTLYTDPFGVMNAVGHFFQIASFYLVYVAIIETVMLKPQDILYRNLQQSKEEVTNLNSELASVNFDLKQDISVRVQAEKDLKASEEKYRNLFSNMVEEVHFWKLVRDSRGQIQTWRLVDANPPTIKTWGRQSVEEIKGKTTDEIFGPGSTEHYMEIVRKVMSSGLPHSYEDYFPNLDKYFRFTTVPLGEYFITTGANITEIKQAGESMRRYALELESTNKELESFSYSVSHDLKAPLRHMDGFSHILAEDYADKLDEQGKEYLDKISGASRSMSSLIDDILKLSRITRAPLDIQTLDLSKMAGQVASELSGSHPDRHVEFRIAPGLTASGDRVLLKLVLDNLLGNAFKFTGRQPQAVIEFGTVTQDNAPVFYVRDNGAGFDMSHVDDLFKPFRRLHTETDFPGTGIGLASVQRIISRHHGRVWA